MKMKKVVGVATSVVLAVSMVAATAFAAETAPASPTSADKDAGKITFEATGSSSEGMNIELKTTTVSATEEEALKAAGSTDPADVLAALPNVVYEGGVCGTVKFNATGDAEKNEAVVKHCNTETGEWEYVKTQSIEE